MGSEDALHEPDLEEIHGNICFAVSVPGLFSEQERRDIISSAEEEAVAEFYIFIDHMVAAHEREDERQPSGIPDGLDIRIGDELAVFCETADDDTDFRFHMHSFFGEMICRAAGSARMDNFTCKEYPQRADDMIDYVKNEKNIHR